MSSVVHAWDATVSIAGTETPWLRVGSSIAYDQPVSTASIDLPLPLPSWVDVGASVRVTAAMDGVALAKPLFTGTFRDPDKNYSTSGKIGTLLCQGPNYKLTYPFTSDLVYAGGAKGDPVSLFTSPIHLGAQSVTWYAVHAADGTTVNKTFTPTADSNFVWIAGRAHGTNSYDASTGDKTTKQHSKILVLQGGTELGRANFPVLSENWSGMSDYTNDANWSDFELFVACDPAISASGGDVTVRFVSGTKPGSSDYDEYEAKNVTWQIAGKTSVRNIVRGLYRNAGFDLGTYSVVEITDLDGTVCYLGGNGKVDAGQVRMVQTDQPIAFVNRIAQLYGVYVFDCGDGEPRGLPIRGVPSGSPQETFVEGASGFSFRSFTDASKVYNAVRVEGASGSDTAGKKFAYLYETASPPANDLIPNPPGVNKLRISNTLLTSDTRCQQVGQIQEANNSDQTFVSWESWPHGVAPGRTVRVTAPTVGFDGLLFLTSVRHDLSAQGFRGSFAGWKGVADAFAASFPPSDANDDPDPSQDDPTPTFPRPDGEWFPSRPSSSVNN